MLESGVSQCDWIFVVLDWDIHRDVPSSLKKLSTMRLQDNVLSTDYM